MTVNPLFLQDYDLFYLSCRVKYTYFFSDINECNESHEMKKCHQNASCINTQGSYNCSSNPTYIGNGFECEGTFGLSQTFLTRQSSIG